MSNLRYRSIIRIVGATSLIAILLGLGTSAIAAPPDQGGGLFTHITIADGADLFDSPTIVRTRFVVPDFDQVSGTDDASDVLVLNLFEDANFIAILDYTKLNPSGSLSWMGRLEGVEYSSVALVVRDGMMLGSVNMPGALYQIRYAGDGVHIIHEMNSAAFPRELEPIPVYAPVGAPMQALNAPTADDGSIIDVLVVYTDDARAGEGSTVAIQNRIDLAIAETNQSYINSGITQRVNLVHTAEVSYDESDFNWYTTLNCLELTTDGCLDNVHTLRDNYCADEVVMLVENMGYCGLANMMAVVSPSFEDNAFALVNRSGSCATGYYSFGHEMGHNMGARHDWYIDSLVIPYSYSHGYVNATDRWRTIMAYNWECSDQGFNCARLPYWSNPSVLYEGDPMGVPAGTSTSCSQGALNPHCDADNQQVLDNTAYVVSNFRDSAPCSVSSYSISGYVRNSSGVGLSGVDVDFDGGQPAVTTDNSGYYAQSGFVDNDYTVTFGEPGYFFSPVEDLVTISGANVTHDATASPIIPTSLPFSDGFESGDLGTAWAVETDYDGRVQVGAHDPHGGTYSLLLDNAVNDGFYSYASAILALDLDGLSEVEMSFWWQDFDDDDDGYDGVFISDNYGASWYQALSFSGGPTFTYTQSTIDLDAAASTAGMSLNDHFLIKFQFYDNFQIDSDGYGIDDLELRAVGPVVYDNLVLDDDNNGGSSGNDDGVIDCGESIEMWVNLYNEGTETLTGITATISSSDPYITFTDNVASSYTDIVGLGTGWNSYDFDFDVDPNTPHTHQISFDVDITASNGGPWSDTFDVMVFCITDWIYLPIIMR